MLDGDIRVYAKNMQAVSSTAIRRKTPVEIEVDRETEGKGEKEGEEGGASNANVDELEDSDKSGKKHTSENSNIINNNGKRQKDANGVPRYCKPTVVFVTNAALIPLVYASMHQSVDTSLLEKADLPDEGT